MDMLYGNGVGTSCGSAAARGQPWQTPSGICQTTCIIDVNWSAAGIDPTLAAVGKLGIPDPVAVQTPVRKDNAFAASRLKDAETLAWQHAAPARLGLVRLARHSVCAAALVLGVFVRLVDHGAQNGQADQGGYKIGKVRRLCGF